MAISPVKTFECCKQFLLPLLFSLFIFPALAQPLQKNRESQPIRSERVIEEHSDKDDNIIRTVEYYKGNTRMTETRIIKTYLHRPINPDTLNKDSVSIVVHKSRYVVEVYYGRRMIRSYKAVFGPKPMENKKMEGDRCTPEGWFIISSKNPSSKYNKFMLLNYPNDSAIEKFNRMKEAGTVPHNARIGGDIGIHGVWKGGDELIDKKVCWTDGCIALKNKDIEELYSFTGVGTRVFIKK